MITGLLKLTKEKRLALVVAAILCLCLVAGAQEQEAAQEQETTPQQGLVTMQFDDIDFRDLIRVCAQQAGTDVLLEKSVRKKVSVNCENEPGLALLERIADEQGLRSCAVGEITVFYQMPFIAYRRYNGPDDYTDFLPEAAKTYISRLSDAAGVRISLKADDTDLRVIFGDIAGQAGAEFREGYAVRGNVWVDLSDVPASDAFTAVVVANGYGITVEDGAWVVGRAESFADD